MLASERVERELQCDRPGKGTVAQAAGRGRRSPTCLTSEEEDTGTEGKVTWLTAGNQKSMCEEKLTCFEAALQAASCADG